MKNEQIAELLKEKNIYLDNFFIVVVDGKYCKTLKDFIAVVGGSFHFPENYGTNMNAFWEAINDLDWLDKPNYALVIADSKYLMCEETEEIRHSILVSIKEMQEEWANVPNYDGEDEYRKKARFEIFYI